MKRILGMGSVNNNYELLTIVSYAEQQLTQIKHGRSICVRVKVVGVGRKKRPWVSIKP